MALQRMCIRYGAAGLLIQALASCGQPQPEPQGPPEPTVAANPAPAAREVARPAGPEQLILAFGDSLYRGEIEHFRDLWLAGATTSPVLPPSQSIAALAILDRARSASR